MALGTRSAPSGRPAGRCPDRPRRPGRHPLDLLFHRLADTGRTRLRKPITQPPMRSISVAPGGRWWQRSRLAIATRSTGIWQPANHTRTAGRNAVFGQQALENSSATISMVARSTGVVAACLSACGSGYVPRSKVRRRRDRLPAPASPSRPGRGGTTAAGTLLGIVDRGAQPGEAEHADARWSSTSRSRAPAARPAVQPAEHRRPARAAQARRVRHQARLVGNVAQRHRHGGRNGGRRRRHPPSSAGAS